jgi:hypothetical protein
VEVEYAKGGNGTHTTNDRNGPTVFVQKTCPGFDILLDAAQKEVK